MVTKNSMPTRQKKKVLELQTGSASPMSCGATRMVTGQYEEMDQSGNILLSSSTTVTQQAGPLTTSAHSSALRFSLAKTVPTQPLWVQQTAPWQVPLSPTDLGYPELQD